MDKESQKAKLNEEMQETIAQLQQIAAQQAAELASMTPDAAQKTQAVELIYGAAPAPGKKMLEVENSMLGEGKCLADVVDEAKPGTVFPGRMSGIVTRFDEESSCGFIHCEQVMTLWERDVLIHRQDLESCSGQVGSSMSFLVFLNEQGHPQADQIQLVHSVANGNGNAIQDASAQGAAALTEGMALEWGRGKDISQLPPLPTVQATGDLSIEYKNYVSAQCKAQNSPAPAHAHFASYGAMYAQAMGMSDVAAALQADDRDADEAYQRHDPFRRFSGTVERFKDWEGFGFIICDDARRIYGREVFLHRSEVGHEVDLHRKRCMNQKINNGDTVSFCVDIIDGRPKAKKVEIEISMDDPEEQQGVKRKKTMCFA